MRSNFLECGACDCAFGSGIFFQPLAEGGEILVKFGKSASEGADDLVFFFQRSQVAANRGLGDAELPTQFMNGHVAVLPEKGSQALPAFVDDMEGDSHGELRAFCDLYDRSQS